MHSTSLLLFAVVLIIALQSVPISGKPTKAAATTTTAATTLATTTKASGAAKTTEKAPAAKPAGKVSKKKPKADKKSKKPKQSPWKAPTADQKKLFNDYKAILRTKLLARHQNISTTYQLEATKYGSQVDGKTVLHHYLIKLPDSKYAHAIIGQDKDAKKPAAAAENHAEIRRTIYDTLAAAEA